MFKRILTAIANGVLIVVVAAGGLGLYTVRRQWPQIIGTVSVPGLQSRVEVYRDRYGIPHIYADSAHDLFCRCGPFLFNFKSRGNGMRQFNLKLDYARGSCTQPINVIYCLCKAKTKKLCRPSRSDRCHPPRRAKARGESSLLSDILRAKEPILPSCGKSALFVYGGLYAPVQL